MSVSPYIRFLRPKVCSWIQQTCGLRNSMRIGKDIYELAIDVRHFCKDDLRIIAKQDRILIEGKHERKLDEGVIIKEFSRKYKLPSGVDPKKIQSKLTNEGLLTITAPRDEGYVAKEECETEVPIIIKDETIIGVAANESADEVKKEVKKDDPTTFQ